MHEVTQFQTTQPLMYEKQSIQLNNHEGLGNIIAFSHDCKMAASGAIDRSLNLWCLKTKEQLKSYRGFKSLVQCLAFSKCDTQIASSHFNQILIWDISQLQLNTPLYILKGHAQTIGSLIFAKDFLMSCSSDKTIRLWRGNKQIACQKFKDKLDGMSLFQDEQFILGNSGNYSSRCYNSIWQVGKKKQIISWNNPQSEECSSCVSNNSKLIFLTYCSASRLVAWNCYSGKPKMIRKCQFTNLLNCSVSSDSTIVAIREQASHGYNCSVHLIDISTWNRTQILDAVGNGVSGQFFFESKNTLIFSSNDEYLGAGSLQGPLNIFRIKDQKVEEVFPKDTCQNN